MLVALLIVAFLPGPIFVRLDAGLGFQRLDQLASLIAVVSRVGENVFGLAAAESGEQFATERLATERLATVRLATVRAATVRAATVRAATVRAGAELHSDQTPLDVDGRMDFRIQTSARPAETAATVGVFFFSSA